MMVHPPLLVLFAIGLPGSASSLSLERYFVLYWRCRCCGRLSSFHFMGCVSPLVGGLRCWSTIPR